MRVPQQSGVVEAETARPERARSIARFGAPAILFVIIVLFNWKLVLTNQYTWLDGFDYATQVLPWFQQQAGEWHAGRFPLWDPYGWYGQPLLAQAQPGAAYPPNWLLFLLPLKNGWMRQSFLHWYFVLIHCFAALTAYALCRDLGRSRLASIFGGCLYALGGYVGNTDWPQMINGAVWSPLVFLFLLRAARGERPVSSALLSGFFLGFGWLGGHHQMNLFVTLAAAGLWIWLATRRGRIEWNIAKLAAASLAVAAMASALQTFPTAEYGRLAVRWASAEHELRFDEMVPYGVHQRYSLYPGALLGIFIPGVHVEGTTYFGVIGFTLAVLGAILTWREPRIRWLAMIGIGAVLFELGFSSVLHGVMYALVPLVEKSRTPLQGSIVFGLALAPLAAYGLDAIHRPESALWSVRTGRVLFALAAVLAAVTLIFYEARINPESYNERMMIAVLGACAAAGVFAAWRAEMMSHRFGSVFLILITLVELSNVTNYQLPSAEIPGQIKLLPQLSKHSDFARVIRAHGIQARVALDNQEIPYNFGGWYGLETRESPGPSMLASIHATDLWAPRMQDFFGVRYYIGKAPLSGDFREIFTGASGLKLYENPNAFPRVWSVHQVEVAADARQLRRLVSNAGTDLRVKAILPSAPSATPQDCPSDLDDIQLTTHRPEYVHIAARMNCRGLVILSDSWYPGWRATVDGTSVPILEVDGAVRGVLVDAGTHRIEMKYRPWSVYLGALSTLTAALIALWACFRRELPNVVS